MKKIHDIIIIGGGIAGMTAGLYGYRSGKDVLIIEKSFFGGQIITTSEIENYPGFTSIAGHSFASELYQQIMEMDIPHVSDEVSHIKSDGNLWQVICAGSSYTGRSVIIATGTINRKLGLADEEKYTGHGLSYCATCDGAFHKNKTAAVVGGGSNALEEALYLSLLCSTVYLIHRSDHFTGEEELQKRVFETRNIKVLFNTEITGLLGDEHLKALKTVTYEDTVDTASYPISNRGNISDKSPERQIKNTGKTEVNGLFVAIGQIPRNEQFSSVAELDGSGYIITDESCHTKSAGIFAAGDCRAKKLRQLVTAASDGAIAATEAIAYLREHDNH